jgi:hypothetical protein
MESAWEAGAPVDTSGVMSTPDELSASSCPGVALVGMRGRLVSSQAWQESSGCQSCAVQGRCASKGCCARKVAKQMRASLLPARRWSCCDWRAVGEQCAQIRQADCSRVLACESRTWPYAASGCCAANALVRPLSPTTRQRAGLPPED